MSIKSRINKAKQASKLVVLCSDFREFAKSYGQRSLTDPSVNYQQTLSWIGKDKIEDVEFLVVSCQCRKIEASSIIGTVACEDNSNGTICYHCLAALMFAASQKGQSLSLFDDFSKAVNYQKLGGQLIKVISGQGDGKAWAVVKARTLVIVEESSILKSLRTAMPEKITTPAPNSILTPSWEQALNRTKRFDARVNLLRGEVEKGIE